MNVDVATRGEKPEIPVDTAKLGGCIGISGFGESGDVGEDGLAKNVAENLDKTNCFQLFFEIVNKKVL